TLGIGWSNEHRAWSFPMQDASGRVVGIRLRAPRGAKFAVKGGHEGLFLPATATLVGPGSQLLIVEGATDTAALLDMGVQNGVGRPCCMGGVKLLVGLVRLRQRPEVVVADGDEPGQRGAEHLASILLAYVPAVRLIRPPNGIKDARAWLQAGGTEKDVLDAIDA